MICLDATGQMLDSVQLSDAVFKKLETGGSRLCFVIGGAEGLPPDLHPSRRGSGGGKSSIEYLSLSRLTFTHQVTPSGYSYRNSVALTRLYLFIYNIVLCIVGSFFSFHVCIDGSGPSRGANLSRL